LEKENDFFSLQCSLQIEIKHKMCPLYLKVFFVKFHLELAVIIMIDS